MKGKCIRYEALEAVVDAGSTFKFEVDTTELILKLASMETDKLIHLKHVDSV